MASPGSAACLRAELHRLDLKIAGLTAQLSAASVARQRLANRLREMVSDGIDILALPVEITSEIFLHAVQKVALEAPSRTGDLPLPLALASVCREWRTIALSLPGPWSKIDISSLRGSTLRAMELLSLCIQRSGNLCLLDVEIRRLPEGVLDILRVLSTHSMRWTRFAFNASQTQGLPAFFNDLRGQVPQLRILELRALGPIVMPCVGFAVAPLLREVHLTAIRAENIHLQWAQLETVHIEYLRTEGVVEILARTANIRDLALRVYSLENDMSPSELTLHHLESLSLLLENDSEMAWLGEILLLPQLRQLTVRWPEYPGLERKDFASPIIDLIQVSQCRIQTLTMKNVTVASAVALLQNAPTVVELTIDGLADFKPDELWYHINHRLELYDYADLRRLRVRIPQVELPYTGMAKLAAKRANAKENPELAQRLRRLGEISWAINEPLGDDEWSLAHAERDLKKFQTDGCKLEFLCGQHNFTFPAKPHPSGSLAFTSLVGELPE